MKKWNGYQHGIDLGGWLSQCDHTKERYETFIVESDVEKIASWGLDHVRVPIDYELVEDEAGNEDPSGYVYIDRVVNWCEKYGLNMVLDLHKTYGYSFDKGENEEGFFENEAYQERFIKLWERLAKKYGNIGERLAFELLNEVTDKSYCDTWNRVSTECIKRIRVIAPDVKILIGGYWNNSIEALKDLLPPYDENIIYNFHCYEPLIFTHQGAYWIDAMDTNFRLPITATYKEMDEMSKKYINIASISFDDLDPNGTLDVAYFEKYFAEAVRIAEERNVPLYCGEYGMINLATPEDTLKWYELIHEAFEKFGIGRAAWNYKEMDFGFIDDHMKDVLDKVVKLL